MVDSIKILDLSVSAQTLLTNPALLFPLAVEESTGAVLTNPRRATVGGLTFTLVPTRADATRYRVEVVGSLHRYARNGQHNADDFTAAELLAVLDQLVMIYGIDPFTSTLNNVEFGANIRLPFAVSTVLDALICYKGVPFTLHHENGFSYYQAALNQYVVKVYDKGRQYSLPYPVLRVEVKVLKMQYLRAALGKNSGAPINVLADLLTTGHYPALGRLLLDTFTAILFDEPFLPLDSIQRTADRELILKGRAPRYWQRPEPSATDYSTARKRLQREEQRFRALLDKYRVGDCWQTQTADLLREKWAELSAVSESLQSQINQTLTRWQSVEKCPKFTGVIEETTDRETPPPIPQKCPKFTGGIDVSETGEMSQIYPLYVGGFWDNAPTGETSTNTDRETIETTDLFCPITGVRLDQPRPRQRFVSGRMLARDTGLLAAVSGRYGQYAKGSKESQPVRAAHGARNEYFNPKNNPRNNLKRRIGRVHRQPVLFDDVDSLLRLTADQRAALNR